jgi:hypothetical protein
MKPIYRYRRVDGKTVKTPLTDPVIPKLGEMIALPGKRDRRSRRKVTLGIDGKPLRPPLTKIQGRKPA